MSKKIPWIGAFIFTVAMSFFAGTYYGADDDGPDSTAGTSEREILYWVAPMDANYRRDEPGRSPMGMDLVPVYADEIDGQAGVVSIDPAVVNNLGVRTTSAGFGSLPRVVDTGQIKAYPALVDDGDSVAIRLHPSVEEQTDAMWVGARRLLRLNLPGPVKLLDGLLPERVKLHLVTGHVQSRTEWYNDGIAAALDSVIAEAGGPPWTEAEFDALLERARSELPDRLAAVAEHIARLLPTIDEMVG